MNRVLLTSTLALALAPFLNAQPPSGPPTSAVLTTLTARPDVERSRILKVLPEEVRATVKMYLDGKIQQWYARSDGKGVVFILNCGSVEEAKGLMESLPLGKARLATFEFTALGPLTPLRLLLTETPPR